MINGLKLELFLRGIKQAEIARRAGVNPAYVNRIVNGKQVASIKVKEALKEVGIDEEVIIANVN